MQVQERGRQPDDLRHGREHPGLQQGEALLGAVAQAVAARVHDLREGHPMVPEIRRPRRVSGICLMGTGRHRGLFRGSNGFLLYAWSMCGLTLPIEERALVRLPNFQIEGFCHSLVLVVQGSRGFGS